METSSITLLLEDCFSNAGVVLRVVTTPGHTFGSISVIADTPKGLVAVVGDAFMSKEEYLQPKVPEWVEDKEAYLRSIDKLKKLNPKAIIPGQDSPFSVQKVA